MGAFQQSITPIWPRLDAGPAIPVKGRLAHVAATTSSLLLKIGSASANDFSFWEKKARGIINKSYVHGINQDQPYLGVARRRKKKEDEEMLISFILSDPIASCIVDSGQR